MSEKIYSYEEAFKSSFDYFDQDSLAAKVWLDKYALRDSNGNLLENTPDKMHRRLSNEFAKILSKRINNLTISDEISEFGKNFYKKIIDKSESELSDLIFSYFDRFSKIVPQGRVMAGLGVKESYRSLSNCLRLPPPEDSYNSILYSDTCLVAAAKRGCGYGLGISKLRPEGANVKNSANTSTGAVSFMHRFSFSTREVAQSGRRGACLIDMDVRHPDIEQFISIKSDLTKVTGANISVKCSDDFLEAVEKDIDYILRFPVDADISSIKVNQLEFNKLTNINNILVKKVKAKNIFNQIVKQARDNAEPGVFFWDMMQNYDPASVYKKYKIDGTNACVSAGTLILTENGYKKVEDINIGEKISTSFGFEPVKTVEKHDNYKVLDIYFSDGGKISVTSNHIFYGRQEKSISKKNVEIKANDLKIGSKIKLLKQFSPIENNYDNYNKYLKIGILIGDGCFTKNQIDTHNTILIASSVDDTEYNNKIVNLFNIKNKPNESKDSKTVSFNFSNAKEILSELGLQTYSSIEDKNIDIFSLKKNGDFIGFLDGLLATDGNINYTSNHPQVRWFTSNEKLAQNIRNCLFALGCQAGISMSNDEGGIIKGRKIERNYPKYTVSISGDSIQTYIKYSKLGEIHPVKGKSLNNLLKEYSLTGNTWYATVTKIENGQNSSVYDLYCEGSDTWGANGYLNRGCGEQPMAVGDTCRLILLNLFGFIKNAFSKDSYFSYDELYESAYMQLVLGDLLVDLEVEYIDRILNKIKSDNEPESQKKIDFEFWSLVRDIAYSGRRTGCGISGLADTIAGLNLKYDSDDSKIEIEKIMKKKMEAELDASIDLSILFGSFSGFNPELEKNGNIFFTQLEKEFPNHFSKMQKFGRRNVNWSTVAPAGSVSILTQTSSGCEPLFSPYYTRRIKINPNDKNKKIDFVDQNGDKWENSIVIHPKLKLFLKNNGFSFEISDIEKGYKISSYFNSTANDISWEKRIKIQSVLQKYTTSAISTTLNLPESTSEETVYNIYIESWKNGLKGQTIYRENSRSGVLIKEEKKKEISINKTSAPKRPQILNCDVYHFVLKGTRYYTIVGLLNKDPYEIFTGINSDSEGDAILNKNIINGQVKKESRGKYILINNNTKYTLSNSHNDPTADALTRLISTSLRHGVDISFIVDQLEKTKGEMISFTKVLGRTLKKYIKDGTKVCGQKCDSCGSTNLVRENGCVTCRDCGGSKCS